MIEHTHTDDCYYSDGTLRCNIAEHTHTPLCTADAAADWREMFNDVVLTGNWNDDLLAIAETQIGYTESTKNVIDKDGYIKGYSRYGAWYGDPYGEWCAMFCSFCLNYAEVDSELFPREANCQQWIKLLADENYDLFREADGYTPVPSDLVFFNLDHSDDEIGNPVSDHIGIVAEVYNKTVEMSREECAELLGVEPEELDDMELPEGIYVVSLPEFDSDEDLTEDDGEYEDNAVLSESVFEETAADEDDKIYFMDVLCIRTIEGNCGDAVCDTMEYEVNGVDREKIMGFGELPENPHPETAPGYEWGKISSETVDGIIYLTAEPDSRLDAYHYFWQWQRSIDQISWENIDDAYELEYSFSEENADDETVYYYRITGEWTDSPFRDMPSMPTFAVRNIDKEALIEDALDLTSGSPVLTDALTDSVPRMAAFAMQADDENEDESDEFSLVPMEFEEDEFTVC